MTTSNQSIERDMATEFDPTQNLLPNLATYVEAHFSRVEAEKQRIEEMERYNRVLFDRMSSLVNNYGVTNSASYRATPVVPIVLNQEGLALNIRCAEVSAIDPRIKDSYLHAYALQIQIPSGIDAKPVYIDLVKADLYSYKGESEVMAAQGLNGEEIDTETFNMFYQAMEAMEVQYSILATEAMAQ